MRLRTAGDAAAAADREAQSVESAIAQAAKPLQRFRCAACGFEAQSYFWQCPGCLNWDSYPPQRLEDL
jgi:lipopolysaccharide biosynthesis regulator YciM